MRVPQALKQAVFRLHLGSRMQGGYKAVFWNRFYSPHSFFNPLEQFLKSIVAVLVLVAASISFARAQGNYEIQVYGSDTVEPRHTMFELHSNYTAKGHPGSPEEAATHHALHETVEVTQGITNWSEVGFYLFTTIQSDVGAQWVGDHIRPRVRVPPEWKWPVGVSLSQEIGYQRALFDQDTWTWEIRPIVDKQKGRLYWSVNPAFERAFHGPGVSQGFDFAPGVKVGWDFTKVVSAGFEYYGDYGDFRNLHPLHDQQQMLFPSVDLNVSPDWEINFGVGIGATAATDHLIYKVILGRRFNWGKPKMAPQPHQP
jgi:hypothetical protein